MEISEILKAMVYKIVIRAALSLLLLGDRVPLECLPALTDKPFRQDLKVPERT